MHPVRALAALVALAPSAHAKCRTTPDANRQVVLAFYQRALGERQVRDAFERWASPDFVEHKPSVPEGTRAATIDFLEGLVAEAPDPKWEVVRTVAEGDLVVLHARFTPAPGAPDYAIADLFRVERCRIVEHWDVVSGPVEDPRNPNSRF